MQQSGTMGLKIAELVFVPPNAIDQLSCVLFRVLFHVYVCWSREHVNKTYFLFGKVFQSVTRFERELPLCGGNLVYIVGTMVHSMGLVTATYPPKCSTVSVSSLVLGWRHSSLLSPVDLMLGCRGVACVHDKTDI